MAVIGSGRSDPGDIVEPQQYWFTEMMKAGLESHLLEPADVLAHATPEILAEHLPADVIARIFQESLSTGSLTPNRILEIVTPELLARYVPPRVLWACIASAAKRSGLTEASAETSD